MPLSIYFISLSYFSSQILYHKYIDTHAFYLEFHFDRIYRENHERNIKAHTACNIILKLSYLQTLYTQENSHKHSCFYPDYIHNYMYNNKLKIQSDILVNHIVARERITDFHTREKFTLEYHTKPEYRK